MTKREKFGLEFGKWPSPTNPTHYTCRRNVVGPLSHLQFLSRLDVKECVFLIKEIEKAQSNIPYDECPTSDSFEDIQVDLIFPNVIINEVLTISMDDFKELLEEWIDYIK